MSDALFERYKEALRRGHVAALRGRLEAAAVAYGEAAEIAPERPLPHASLGSVLHRLGRLDEALVAYATALDRAPTDAAALTGRADVLEALGRPVEAAETLDRLSAVHSGAGRPAAACVAGARALRLAESRPRRRDVESLVAVLRALPAEPADPAVAEAIELATAVLEPSAAGPGMAAEMEPEEEIVDGAGRPAEGEQYRDAGDATAARAAFLDAARLLRADGRLDAAIDACYLALAVAPADAELHLALTELYLDRGWRAHAVDKLALLVRLVDLEGDCTTRDRVCALVADRLPDEPRLVAACA